MADAGYSGTPLPRKLGLKDGQAVGFCGLPESLKDLKTAAAFIEAGEVTDREIEAARQRFDVLMVFLVERARLENLAQPMMDAIKRDGMVWVAWPKKASKVTTDITEDVIREVILPLGLVDVKVCAVDAVYSGLKLVIRKPLR